MHNVILRSYLDEVAKKEVVMWLAVAMSSRDAGVCL